MRNLTSILLVTSLVAVALWGCASTTSAQIERPAESKSDRLLRFRGALRTLRSNESAKYHDAELDRTEVWLLEAERAPADADESRIAMLMDAVESQLSRVQAAFARRDAESQLENRRQTYVARQQNVARLEAETGSK